MEAINAAAAAGDFAARSFAGAVHARATWPTTASRCWTALGIERAHVVGASMGGMIAQTMAIEHPERVLTLTSMMSTTGEPEYGESSPEAMQALLTPPPSEREPLHRLVRTRAALALQALARRRADAGDRGRGVMTAAITREGTSRQLARDRRQRIPRGRAARSCASRRS